MGAWVDLRIGDTFGKVVTRDLDPGTAVFVPRGIANAHQVLEDHTTFSYLLNHHWTPEARARFSAVNLFDPALGITWPIPRDRAELTHSDLQQPLLAHTTPMQPRRTLVVGTDTRLGRALLAELPGAVGISAPEMDAVIRGDSEIDLSAYDILINAQGDTGTGSPREPYRPRFWSDAAVQSRYLTDIARRHRMRYVHVSADCVFDRVAPTHAEDEALSLLPAPSQSLAMGEALATTVPRHLVIRTGWVMGRGENWLDDMVVAARHGRTPEVVGDQHGRLTFADVLAAGITHLLDSGAPSGTYNLTGDGPVVSWLAVARRVFELCARNPDDVHELTRSPGSVGASPGNALDLTKIKAAGFRPGNAWLQLEDHVPPVGASRTPTERPRPVVAAPESAGVAKSQELREPYRVLFVCTANICRSAYADVVSRSVDLGHVAVASAGTHALVGQGMDPPMAAHVPAHADAASHRARQITRQMVTEADLVLAMGVEHRRYILDEWPALGRKVFLMGHVAREMTQLPESVTLEDLAAHLWKHRSADPADEVADPYGRGSEAAATCASVITTHLNAILGGIRALIDETEHP